MMEKRGSELQVTENLWFRIETILRMAAERLDEGFPYVTDRDGTWRCLAVDRYAGWESGEWSHGNWFCGFWIGLMWLAYELTDDDTFSDEAHRWAERMKFRQNDPNSHDIGYLFIPSFVKGYLLTGAPFWRVPALTAAHGLAGRFEDRMGIVQAWGRLDDPRARGSSTIDTMMNLPLLWWAAKETGDRSFFEIASRHAEVSASVYIREDGSTYHTARFDPATGRLTARGTYQGLSEASCWSRGQAWAISGFSEAYRHTGDRKLLEAVEIVSDYYFDNVPDDLVPYWDYTDPEIPEAPRDSAAAAIAAGGFLTMSEVHPDSQKRTDYGERASQVLGSLVQGYFNGESGGNHQGILLHACYSKPHNEGVDSSLITGDFFFVQNLVRASRPKACAGPFNYSQSEWR
jgi:unsaturated chondroitin disaccharide hydrolase